MGVQHSSTRTVAVIAEHGLIRAGLKFIVENSPNLRIVEEIQSPPLPFQRLQHVAPDIVIIDLPFGTVPATQLIRQICTKLEGKVKILALSRNRLLQEETLLLAGACGCCIFPISVEEVRHALYQITNDNVHLTRHLYAQRDREIRTLPQHHKLSSREKQVLFLLVRGKRQKDIAEQLKISPKTVATYRQRILLKLQLKTTAELVEYALSNSLFQ